MINDHSLWVSWLAGGGGGMQLTINDISHPSHHCTLKLLMSDAFASLFSINCRLRCSK